MKNEPMNDEWMKVLPYPTPRDQSRVKRVTSNELVANGEQHFLKENSAKGKPIAEKVTMLSANC